MNPMLVVDNLRAGYAGVPVVHGASLHVARGEIVSIIGANGAGKSTLVACLCGLVQPMSGRVMMDGRDVTAVPAHRRQASGIAVVLEGRHLFPELSVRDNLAIAEATGERQRRGHRRLTRDEVFELFPVVRERLASPVGLLSGGQQQMVAIARALLLQPDLLVLDELTTGLAPIVVKDILNVLTRLRDRGLSLLLVEQSIRIAADLSDRSYVMSVGRMVHEVGADDWPRLLADDALVKAYLHG
ncbi:ABC transporter ATP-binding protein [Ideonella sp. DXS22W]|uniref:ABC transporter ATP-binding protein n=1 Tax=Pseudaquabacterium inlustre TaxID=2984192 RepID=A0ABU9CMP9_9BURK